MNDIRSHAYSFTGNVTTQQKNLLIELSELEDRLKDALDASLNRSINTIMMDRLEKLFHVKSMSEIGSFTDSPLELNEETATPKKKKRKNNNPPSE